ncbi:MAG: hemerythrin domain-containing protein [Acidiferrobacteraceae bacterium]
MTLLHLFRRDPSAQDERSPISYDRDLIDLLRQDHRRLIRQLQDLQKLSGRYQYKDILTRLAEFRSLLQTHLMTENVRLYGYLAYALDTYGEDARRVGEFRREMYGLGHNIMAFVKKYMDAGVNKENIAEFRKELAEVGATLVRRIRREENDLFALYGPTAAGSRNFAGRKAAARLNEVFAR